MRVRVIWPGKTKDARLRALINDYLERLAHFVRCEIIEIREGTGAETRTGINKYARRISDRLSPDTTTVLLDPQGIEWTSEQLAAQMRRWENSGIKEVAFMVGGPNGIAAELSSRVDKRWALSRLTLTHEMARVVLLEQLYRAYAINHGLPYQK